MSQSSPIGGAPSSPVFRASAADASRALTVFVLLVVILYFGREVLIPITLALMLAFLLAPVVTFLRKLHLGRVPAVLLAVIMAIASLLMIGGVIGSQISDLATNLPHYARQIEAKVSRLESGTVGRFSHLVDRFGTNHAAPQPQAPRPQPTSQPTQPAQTGAGSPQPAATPTPAPAAAAAPASPRTLIMEYLEPVLSPFATLGIVIIITIFALLQREDLRDRLIRLIGSDDIHRTTVAMDDAGRRLGRYFLTQLAVNTFFGLVIGIGLFFIGVPKPILWGVLSGLLRFVPYVGSFISALLPITLAAAVEPGWSMAIWTAIFFVLVEGVTGQAVEPLLYGHSTGLSPFSVIVAAIFWSWVWGPIGLILSTPLTLCLVVMGRHVQRLEFLDVMLGDRPALTPVESFYQRILADDPDEALDQAELFLKQQSLSTYYDQVALKAMQMAAYDAERGVLVPAQLNAVVKTIQVLVANLDEHDEEPAATPPVPTDDAEIEYGAAPAPAVEPIPAPEDVPAAWREPSSVLCVAGRGALDAPATPMLTQIMTRQKFGCRAVPHAEAGRETIRELDVAGVKIACIAYLDVSSSLAHLRYLIRRLRQRLPRGTPILVGLWPVEDQALHDDRTRAAIGADYFASSFADVLEICRKLSRQETPPEVPAIAA